MANNCSTRIVLFGNDKALADIRTRLESRAVSHVNDVMKIYGIDEEFCSDTPNGTNILRG